MTKAELRDFLKHRLGGIRDDAKFHPKVIEASIDRAWNQIIYDTFRKNLDLMGFYCKEYKNVAISFDSATNRYYCTLPANIIQLPDLGNGVRRISSMKGHGSSFYPVSEAQRELMEGLEVTQVSNDVPFVVRETKVEFGDIDILDYSASTSSTQSRVRMSLVIPFWEYADTDEVHIPAGKDEQLVELVTQFLIGTPQRDNLNDNV